MSKIFLINGENASHFSDYENSLINPKNLKKIGATEVFTLDFNIPKMTEVFNANKPLEVFNIIISAHGNGDFNIPFSLGEFEDVNDILINISKIVGDTPVNIFLITCYAARIFDSSIPLVKGSKIFTLSPKDKTFNTDNERISEDLMASLLEFLKTKQELSVIEKVIFTIITNHQFGEINPQLCMIDELGGNVISLKDLYNFGNLGNIWENVLSEIDREKLFNFSQKNYNDNLKIIDVISPYLNKNISIIELLTANSLKITNKNENIHANELYKLLIMFYVFSTNKDIQGKFATSIHTAMEKNDFNLIEELTKLGVSKHSVNKNGDNILDMAVSKKDINFEAVNFCLNKLNMPIGNLNIYETSPLSKAIESENPDTTQYLTEKLIANIEKTDAYNTNTYSLVFSSFIPTPIIAICNELDKAYDESNLVTGDLFSCEEQF